MVTFSFYREKEVSLVSLKNLPVYKSNAIVSASFRLSLSEQRVIVACISQIRKDEKITDDVRYSLGAGELSELTGASIPSSFRDLKAVTDRLFDRYVVISEKPNGGGKLQDPIKTRWIQSIVFVKKEARIELRFGKEVLPYLNELSRQFTKYTLKNVAQLSSSYGFRLYEFLRKWDGVGKKEVSVEELKTAYQVEGKYGAIKDFKKYVLEPAVSDVNTHSDLQVSWTQRKTGRKVTHLEFTFKQKKEKSGGNKKTKQENLESWKVSVEKNARPGETYEQAGVRIKAEKKKPEPA